MKKLKTCLILDLKESVFDKDHVGYFLTVEMDYV